MESIAVLRPPPIAMRVNSNQWNRRQENGTERDKSYNKRTDDRDEYEYEGGNRNPYRGDRERSRKKSRNDKGYGDYVGNTEGRSGDRNSYGDKHEGRRERQDRFGSGGGDASAEVHADGSRYRPYGYSSGRNGHHNTYGGHSGPSGTPFDGGTRAVNSTGGMVEGNKDGGESSKMGRRKHGDSSDSNSNKANQRDMNGQGGSSLRQSSSKTESGHTYPSKSTHSKSKQVHFQAAERSAPPPRAPRITQLQSKQPSAPIDTSSSFVRSRTLITPSHPDDLQPNEGLHKSITRKQGGVPTISSVAPTSKPNSISAKDFARKGRGDSGAEGRIRGARVQQGSIGTSTRGGGGRIMTATVSATSHTLMHATSSGSKPGPVFAPVQPDRVRSSFDEPFPSSNFVPAPASGSRVPISSLPATATTSTRNACIDVVGAGTSRDASRNDGSQSESRTSKAKRPESRSKPSDVQESRIQNPSCTDGNGGGSRIDSSQSTQPSRPPKSKPEPVTITKRPPPTSVDPSQPYLITKARSAADSRKRGRAPPLPPNDPLRATPGYHPPSQTTLMRIEIEQQTRLTRERERQRTGSGEGKEKLTIPPRNPGRERERTKEIQHPNHTQSMDPSPTRPNTSFERARTHRQNFHHKNEPSRPAAPPLIQSIHPNTTNQTNQTTQTNRTYRTNQVKRKSSDLDHSYERKALGLGQALHSDSSNAGPRETKRRRTDCGSGSAEFAMNGLETRVAAAFEDRDVEMVWSGAEVHESEVDEPEANGRWDWNDMSNQLIIGEIGDSEVPMNVDVESHDSVSGGHGHLNPEPVPVGIPASTTMEAADRDRRREEMLIEAGLLPIQRETRMETRVKRERISPEPTSFSEPMSMSISPPSSPTTAPTKSNPNLDQLSSPARNANGSSSSSRVKVEDLDALIPIDVDSIDTQPSRHLRRGVTSGTKRFFPLPTACVKSVTPSGGGTAINPKEYLSARKAFLASSLSYLHSKNLVPTRKFWRSDGLCVDWETKNGVKVDVESLELVEEDTEAEAEDPQTCAVRAGEKENERENEDGVAMEQGRATELIDLTIADSNDEAEVRLANVIPKPSPNLISGPESCPSHCTPSRSKQSPNPRPRSLIEDSSSQPLPFYRHYSPPLIVRLGSMRKSVSGRASDSQHKLGKMKARDKASDNPSPPIASNSTAIPYPTPALSPVLAPASAAATAHTRHYTPAFAPRASSTSSIPPATLVASTSSPTQVFPSTSAPPTFSTSTVLPSTSPSTSLIYESAAASRSLPIPIHDICTLPEPQSDPEEEEEETNKQIDSEGIEVDELYEDQYENQGYEHYGAEELQYAHEYADAVAHAYGNHDEGPSASTSDAGGYIAPGVDQGVDREADRSLDGEVGDRDVEGEIECSNLAVNAEVADADVDAEEAEVHGLLQSSTVSDTDADTGISLPTEPVPGPSQAVTSSSSSSKYTPFEIPKRAPATPRRVSGNGSKIDHDTDSDTGWDAYEQEMERLTIEFLSRYIQTWEFDRPALAGAYAPEAGFSCSIVGSESSATQIFAGAFAALASSSSSHSTLEPQRLRPPPIVRTPTHIAPTLRLLDPDHAFTFFPGNGSLNVAKDTLPLPQLDASGAEVNRMMYLGVQVRAVECASGIRGGGRVGSRKGKEREREGEDEPARAVCIGWSFVLREKSKAEAEAQVSPNEEPKDWPLYAVSHQMVVRESGKEDLANADDVWSGLMNSFF